MAVAGSVVISRKVFDPKMEQRFYGVLLAVIAGFYLAFAAYFEAASSWRTEVIAVLGFCLLGVLGTRYEAALVIGYPLHGLWDVVHELSLHGALPQIDPGQLTNIPLAYGVFCTAFDLAIGFYFARREAFDSWGLTETVRSRLKSSAL
jgi:hypothetical protein